MTSRIEVIEKLSDELCGSYYLPDLVKARRVAEQLAAILGEPSTGSVPRYIQCWIMIWEARGNVEEAGRLQELDVNRTRAEIDAGDFDRYPKLLASQIEYLQDSLYFQAIRYSKLVNTNKAISCLLEVLDLARRYKIGPDEDAWALYAELIAADDGNG